MVIGCENLVLGLETDVIALEVVEIKGLNRV